MVLAGVLPLSSGCACEDSLLSWGIRSRPSEWMCSFHTAPLWITAKDIHASNCHVREFQA